MWKQKLRPLSSTLLRRRGSKPLSSLHSQLSSFHRIRQIKLPPPFTLPPQNLLNLHFTFCSASAAPLRCWNCNVPASTTAPFLFCDTCRSIQPVDPSVDYFQIFGLDKKFEIEDGRNLEGKYKDWQKKLHPDLVHSKTKEEREYAAEQSAGVTTAYRTLTNPLSRASYILKLEGIHVDEEERITDPDLLSEIMEIREAVEEAGDSQKLNEIQEQMQKKMELWAKSFADAFRCRQYDDALASIRRMTYYKRAIEEIIKKL